MRFQFDDREELAVDAITRPATTWYGKLLARIFGNPTTGKYTGMYKFWLTDDSSPIKLRDSFICDQGLQWYVVAKGTVNTIIAKTHSAHDAMAFDGLETFRRGYGIIYSRNDNEAQVENN